MIADDHKFLGGQVFKAKYGDPCKIMLCWNPMDESRWVLCPLPTSWDPKHNQGGMLMHDQHGSFHWTSSGLRNFIRDWDYLGNHHELYEPLVEITAISRLLEQLEQLSASESGVQDS